MANWSLPTTTDLYTNVLTYLNAKDQDAATMFLNAPSNQPTGAMKWNRTDLNLEEWDGAAWQDRLLSVAGGGTGAATAANARTNLGLGSIATQAASSVAITGGTIAGVAITGSTVAATSLTMSGNIGFDAATRSIGSNTTKLSKLYTGDGVMLPVGTDKYLTS